MNAESSMKFEDALKRLEGIVRDLESGEIEIERALSLFEEGTKLVKICAKKLLKIEKKVEILKKGEDGNDVLELFAGVE
jgi:exodeoxyribonuclease VII small subunit